MSEKVAQRFKHSYDNLRLANKPLNTLMASPRHQQGIQPLLENQAMSVAGRRDHSSIFHYSARSAGDASSSSNPSSLSPAPYSMRRSTAPRFDDKAPWIVTDLREGLAEEAEIRAPSLIAHMLVDWRRVWKLEADQVVCQVVEVSRQIRNVGIWAVEIGEDSCTHVVANEGMRLPAWIIGGKGPAVRIAPDTT